MLDELDKIRWDKLEHAYGEASDVPDFIRDLQSPDETRRKDAIYELFGSIWHQETVYSASPAALPFLFHLLTEPGPQDKPSIATLIASIATGTGYHQVRAHPEYFLYATGEKRRALEEQQQSETSVSEAIHSATLQGLPLLTPYRTHKDPEVRRRVAEAFGRFPEHAEELIPELELAATRETDEEICAQMKESIQSLKGAEK